MPARGQGCCANERVPQQEAGHCFVMPTQVDDVHGAVDGVAVLLYGVAVGGLPGGGGREERAAASRHLQNSAEAMAGGLGRMFPGQHRLPDGRSAIRVMF